MDKLNSILKSRRFWVAALGIAVPLLNEKLGLNLTEEQQAHISAMIIAWIVGETIRSSEGAK